MSEESAELKQQQANIPKCKCGRISPYGAICSECWKSEYDNLCKFATDYECQRDELRKENAELKQCLEKQERALRSIEWITSYEDGGKDTCIADKALVKVALESGPNDIVEID